MHDLKVNDSLHRDLLQEMHDISSSILAGYRVSTQRAAVGNVLNNDGVQSDWRFSNMCCR